MFIFFCFVILFIIGICVGSFLNVVIDRIPAGKTILWGRSSCDYCKKTLGTLDLIPLFSFLFLHRKCRYCHKKLSWQYPLIELATAVIFIALFIIFPPFANPLGFISLFLQYTLAATFLTIFVTDAKYRIIPDEEVAILIVVSGLFIFMRGGLEMLLIHALVGTFYSLFFLFLHLVTRGKGMGFGDVKLAFVIGLLLGFPKIIVAFYLSFLTGACVSTILVLRGRKKFKSKIAFGPFLILGTVISYIWGDELWIFFQKIIGI